MGIPTSLTASFKKTQASRTPSRALSSMRRTLRSGRALHRRPDAILALPCRTEGNRWAQPAAQAGTPELCGASPMDDVCALREGRGDGSAGRWRRAGSRAGSDGGGLATALTPRAPDARARPHATVPITQTSRAGARRPPELAREPSIVGAHMWEPPSSRTGGPYECPPVLVRHLASPPGPRTAGGTKVRGELGGGCGTGDDSNRRVLV